MKQTRLLKTLLAAVCLFVGTSAWGETITETIASWDFQTYGNGQTDKTVIPYSGYVTLSGTTCDVGTDYVEGMAFQGADKWLYRTGNAGLHNSNSGDRKFGVLNLKAGDVITLTASGTISLTGNLTGSDIVNSGNCTVTSDGNAVFSIPKGEKLYTLSVTRQTYREVPYVWTLDDLTADSNVTTDGNTTLTENNAECSLATEPSNCQGLYLEGSWKCYKGSGSNPGLRNISGSSKTIIVPNVQKDDIITIEGNTDAISYIDNAKYSGTKNDAGTMLTYTMGADGNFYFRIATQNNARWPAITKITVYRKPDITDGDYYLKNKANGAYFAAGKNWGTQAITNTQGGHRIGFEVLPTGKYKLNTYIYRDQSPSSDLHYLNANFCDGAAEEWQIVDAGEGYYTISNASGNLTGGDINEALSITDGTGDNTKWQILTAAQRKADIETLMASATSANGVDATFYITAPGFAWADLDDRAAWQGSPTFGGFDNKGSGRFWNAEKFTNPYAAFDVYQELTGLKPGAYKITMQGFYRNGFDNASDGNDNLAILYANNSEVALKNIRYYEYTDDSHSADGFTEDKSGYYVPDSQSDAAKAFNAGNFENELYVVVGNDGNLRIGVKKDAPTGADSDWAVFDNFQLTYYGNTVPVEITSVGAATFVSNYALDFSNVEGLEAYIATAQNGANITFDKVGAVPAGTPLYLRGATADVPVVASAEAVGENLLVAGTDAAVASEADGKFNFILNNVDNVVGFYWAADNTVASNRAYLSLNANPFTGGAKSVNMIFSDDTTGINTVAAQSNETSVKGIYNMQGQRVPNPTKGLYIVDGKKVAIP